MSSMIDPGNATPKYYQLAAIIRQRIEEGEFSEQDAIPSERQLEEQFNLSRPTIRQAIDLLERQGFVYRVHGRGTFVSPRKLQMGMQELTSFSEDMRSRGLEPGQQMLAFGLVLPSKKAAAQLAISDPKQKVLRIKRLRTGNEEPIGIQDSYLALPEGQEITLEEMQDYGSIYAILQNKFGIFPTEAEDTLEVTLATIEESKLLQIPEGSPLLLSVRTLWSQDRQAIEYVRILYRGDRYKYLVRLARSQ